MWTVMMIAMMLPVLLPMLMRYQRATRADAIGLTTVSAAYFLAWSVFGLALHAAVVSLAEAAMQTPGLARATPVAVGVMVTLAGLFQFTRWKARQLACCRAAPARKLRGDLGTAFRHGLQLGVCCIRCCLGPTAILLCLGVMDLWAMAIVAVAIALERLMPGGPRLAHLTGSFATLAGLWLVGRAAL
jgi:predicted metal-binding membrane protein